MNILSLGKKRLPIKESYFDVMILIKTSALKSEQIRHYYLPHIKSAGIRASQVCCLPLIYDGEKRVKAATAKDYLNNNIFPIAKELKTKVLLVADAQYFKFITGKTMASVEQNYTYVLESDYSHIRVIPIINWKSFFANPVAEQKLHLNFKSLIFAYEDTFIVNKAGYVKNLTIVKDPEKFDRKLNELSKRVLAVDIEAFSLQYYDAGLATISLSVDKETSLAVYCDYMPLEVQEEYYPDSKLIAEYPKHMACRINNKKIKSMLRRFFKSRKGLHIYHNATFDTKIIIFECFMKGDVSNVKGLIEGLNHVTEHIEDTYLLTYLALNSCSKQPLDLKSNTAEYMGNYGIEVTDITVHSPQDIIQYNAQDTIATYYLYNKYSDIPKIQKQEQLHSIYIDMIVTTVQMEISGMGMDMNKVNKLYEDMKVTIKNEYKAIQKLLITSIFNNEEAEKAWLKKLGELKVKIPDIYEYREDAKLNPNSGPQLTRFLFDHLKLPVIDKTDKGNPSAKGKVLSKLLKLIS